MEQLLCIGLFLMGLLFLIKGADVFIDCSLWVARRFGLPELVIGATIVSIGTTLPETVVSATAALQGHSDIAYGNAIGSVICNTGLIVGLVLLLRPPAIDKTMFFRGSAFFFFAAALYIASALLFGGIPRFIALLLLGIFAWYIGTSMQKDKRAAPLKREAQGSVFPVLLRLFLSVGAVYFGSQLMVEHARLFAIWLQVPQKIIALTVVALGTSLPELVTAVVAIKKGHGALSVGNVLGANFLNLALVSSASSLLLPIIVDAYAIRTDLIVMLFVMLVFTVPILTKGRGMRIQGAALLGAYLLYVFTRYH